MDRPRATRLWSAAHVAKVNTIGAKVLAVFLRILAQRKHFRVDFMVSINVLEEFPARRVAARLVDDAEKTRDEEKDPFETSHFDTIVSANRIGLCMQRREHFVD